MKFQDKDSEGHEVKGDSTLQLHNSQGSSSAPPPPFQLSSTPTIQREDLPGESEDTATPSLLLEELTRMNLYQQGHLDEGRSPLLDPWASETDSHATAVSEDLTGLPERISTLPVIRSSAERDEALALIEQLYPTQSGTQASSSNGSLPNGIRTLVSAYINGSTDHVLANPEATEEEARHAGYDLMAQIVSEHTVMDGPNHLSNNSWHLSQDEELMAALHDMGYWEDLDRRTVEVARREYEAWTEGSGDSARQRDEADDRGVDDLERYAGSVVPESSAGYFANVSQEDTRAWSAAFISYLMAQAGASDTFSYHKKHTGFARAAQRNGAQRNGRPRYSRVTHPSRLEQAGGTHAGQVDIGSIIHRSRTDSVSWDSIRSGPLQESHSDLIVEFEIVNQAHGGDLQRFQSREGAQDYLQNRYDEYVGTQEEGSEPLPFEAYIGQTFRIYAVGIGGNTTDEHLVRPGETAEDSHQNPIPEGYPTRNPLELGADSRTSRRTGDELDSGGETVGKRYYALHPDFTLDQSVGPNGQTASSRSYAIQSHVTPTEDELSEAR